MASKLACRAVSCERRWVEEGGERRRGVVPLAEVAAVRIGMPSAIMLEAHLAECPGMDLRASSARVVALVARSGTALLEFRLRDGVEASRWAAALALARGTLVAPHCGSQ